MLNVLKNIKKFRKTHGLSQAQLAERAGVSDTLIRIIEQGKHSNVTVNTLEKIERAMERIEK